MEKFLRVLSIICLVLGVAVYAGRVGRYFLPDGSPIGAFGTNFADIGFESILIFLVISYQLKMVQMSRRIKELENHQKDLK